MYIYLICAHTYIHLLIFLLSVRACWTAYKHVNYLRALLNVVSTLLLAPRLSRELIMALSQRHQPFFKLLKISIPGCGTSPVLCTPCAKLLALVLPFSVLSFNYTLPH